MAKKPDPNPAAAEWAKQEEAALEVLFQRLKQELEKFPPELLAEARKKAQDLGKLMEQEKVTIEQLERLTPEKLVQMAEMAYNEFKLGRYPQAEKVFRGLTVLDPENYYYHQMLGATFQRQEKYPEAIVEYGIALRLNPRDSVSLTNRGESYFRAGLYPLALADLNAAIALDSQAKGEDKWINRARMLKKQVEMIQSKG